MSALKQGAPAQVESPQAQSEALHRPFSWLHSSFRHDRQAEFVAKTFDICLGIGLCIELVHSSDLVRLHNLDADPGDEDSPILTVSDTERLLQFAQASAELLASKAEQHIEWLNEAARSNQAAASKGGVA
jgi:hypothetical protein